MALQTNMQQWLWPLEWSFFSDLNSMNSITHYPCSQWAYSFAKNPFDYFWTVKGSKTPQISWELVTFICNKPMLTHFLYNWCHRVQFSCQIWPLRLLGPQNNLMSRIWPQNSTQWPEQTHDPFSYGFFMPPVYNCFMEKWLPQKRFRYSAATLTCW